MTSSSQHLTLEEFASSSSPLPTILLPRSQASRLVQLCELAEMSNPSATFLDFIGESKNGGARGDNNPHVLVTQMALLLYLGEYAHARHLWRRHRGTPSSPEVEGTANDAASGGGDDYAQLEQLWNAAKYFYLWSTGGIHSLTSSSDGMQVEETTPENGNLPFSTLGIRALQSCQSSQTEPLSTYSAELLGVFRSRVNRGLQKSFTKLDCNEFCLRMNLEPDAEQPWDAYGWKKAEDGYLVSDVDVVPDDDNVEEDKREDEKEVDRIGKLTDVVMFLEGKMNA